MVKKWKELRPCSVILNHQINVTELRWRGEDNKWSGLQRYPLYRHRVAPWKRYEVGCVRLISTELVWYYREKEMGYYLMEDLWGGRLRPSPCNKPRVTRRMARVRGNGIQQTTDRQSCCHCWPSITRKTELWARPSCVPRSLELSVLRATYTEKFPIHFKLILICQTGIRYFRTIQPLLNLK